MRIIDLRRNESVIRCNRCGDFFIISRKNTKYCDFCAIRHTGSKSYRLWKQQIFLRDENKCQECGQNYDLRVHHKKRWVDEINLRYELNNGILLCKECHKKKHERKVLSKTICG